MPTGYTNGILSGKITTFQQFAKQCMRNFGATLHMRDEDMDSEFIPRRPSDYYKTEIEKANQLLKDAETLSDKVIVENRKHQLQQRKDSILKAIEESKADAKKLNDILKDVKKWQPPTIEHIEIKNFMIEQIEKTIDFDCNLQYYVENIAKIDLELSNLNALMIRNDIILKAKRDLKYNTERHNKEIYTCEKANKWVSDFIASLS